MPLRLVSLDAQTRSCMLEEVEYDTGRSALYESKYLSSQGRTRWPQLLREAIQSHDDAWLAAQLRAPGMFAPTYQRRTPKGGVTDAKVPHNANEMLAEGEFNRFYMRGLSKRAIAEGTGSLLIYRAKDVENPRPESQARLGASVSPEALLADLRANPGADTVLGVPGGPNSGISVRLAQNVVDVRKTQELIGPIVQRIKDALDLAQQQDEPASKAALFSKVDKHMTEELYFYAGEQPKKWAPLFLQNVEQAKTEIFDEIDRLTAKIKTKILDKK